MALISLSRFTFRGKGTDIYKQIHKKEDAHLVGNLEKMKEQWMESDRDSPRETSAAIRR